MVGKGQGVSVVAVVVSKLPEPRFNLIVGRPTTASEWPISRQLPFGGRGWCAQIGNLLHRRRRRLRRGAPGRVARWSLELDKPDALGLNYIELDWTGPDRGKLSNNLRESRGERCARLSCHRSLVGPS